jgi:hypothetical protein
MYKKIIIKKFIGPTVEFKSKILRNCFFGEIALFKKLHFSPIFFRRNGKIILNEQNFKKFLWEMEHS